MSIVVDNAGGTGQETAPGSAAIYARALGGEAHRTRVRLEGRTPPELLDIGIPGSTSVARYRLLRTPRTRRAITDDQGDYLYLPQRQRLTRPNPP